MLYDDIVKSITTETVAELSISENKMFFSEMMNMYHDKKLSNLIISRYFHSNIDFNQNLKNVYLKWLNKQGILYSPSNKNDWKVCIQFMMHLISTTERHLNRIKEQKQEVRK